MSIVRHSIISLTCITLYVFISTRGDFAQEFEPSSPLPPPSNFDMADYQTNLQEQLADFEIAYIVTEEDEAHLQDNWLGADFLAETFGVTRFVALSDVELWDEVTFDALIVTPGTLTGAPQEAFNWLADVYRHGTIIAFVNVPFETQMAALNITCRSQRVIQLVDYPVDWTAVYQFAVLGEDEDKVQSVIEAYDNCVPEEEIDMIGLDSIEVGSGNTDIVSDERGGLIMLQMLSVLLETSPVHRRELNQYS